MGNSVAIDLGATSGRVIYASYDGRKVRMETVHRFKTPLVEEDGKFFWDIDVLRKEIAEGLGRLKGREVDSIGVDTWGVDFCKVLKDGTLCRPRSYRDPYTNGVPEEFFREMPREELYSRTGIQIMNFNSVFQIYAQKRAGELEDAWKVLFLPDAISYMLTGEMVCEYTMFSTSAMMDPWRRDFDPDILRVCGVERSLFAEVVLPGTKVGTLKEEYGLGPVPVIAVAGHDTASAVYAVPAADENIAYLSSGTWSLMGVESPGPVVNEEMARLNYTNEGGARGNICLLRNTTGMWLLEQCMAKWRSCGRDYSYAEAIAMAEACGKVAKEDLIDPDCEEFASPKDMPKAICGKVGRELGDAEMVRLIIDSLAAKCADVLENLRTMSSMPIDALHIIGGGSRNGMFCQAVADACGIKVIAGPAEGTSLGNVMMQMGLGRKDIMESVELSEYIPENN